MHQALNVLSFRPRTVAWLKSRPRWLRWVRPVPDDRWFQEFLIDGRPLTEVLEVAEGVARPHLEATNLECLTPEAAVRQLDQLLGSETSENTGERVWLLFCPVDHDPGCGGISARITWGDQTVAWSQFGWDDDLEGSVMLLSQDQRFVFDRDQYEKVLRALRAAFATTL